DLTLTVRATVPYGIYPGDAHCEAYRQDVVGHGTGWDHVGSLTITRTPPGRPGAPTDLNFHADRPTSGTLSWTAPTNLGDPQLKDYEIQVRTGDSGEWQTLADGYSTTPSLPLSNLKPDSVYEFRVRGENGGADGLWSEILAVRTPPAQVAEAPREVTVGQVEATSMVVTWDSPGYDGGSAIRDYEVEVSRDAGATWQPVPHAASTGLSLTIKGLSARTDYLVRVAAVNDVGTSPFATAGAATTVGAAPSAPLGLTAEPAQPTSVLLAWQPPADLNGAPLTAFVVEMSRDGGATWTLVGPATLSTSMTIQGLAKNHEYQFRVHAENREGAGPASNVVTVVTATTLPSEPGAPRPVAGYPTATAAKLTWSAPADNGGLPILDYRYELSTNRGKTWRVIRHPATMRRTITIRGLTSDRSYRFRVRAVTAVGASGPSALLRFHTEAAD
ncbi:fibronectin type III domain-containing protein, partial [Nocardioides sp. MAHUQ-72]|uniref:fibronectin type III domain-containing protein n=1 Tax=unclassified Nocardioides TaxID=2615069 RepID=UPI0036214D1B